MMPCRKQKCLLLPTCKSKREIYCSVFFKHIENRYKNAEQRLRIYLYKGYNEIQSNIDERVKRRVWTRLYKTHPNLRRIYTDSTVKQLNRLKLHTPFTEDWYGMRRGLKLRKQGKL